jgi:hexosaminidase
MNLLPCPRVLKRGAGFYALPPRASLWLDSADAESSCITHRLRVGAKAAGVTLVAQQRRARAGKRPPDIRFSRNVAHPFRSDGYALTIDRRGVLLEYAEPDGLRAAVATLRQLLRQFGRRLPWLTIRDWADFPRRGVMLDVSRGRVPKLGTLLGLVDQLADFKINEFQLYVEHTFAYRHYRPVWREWGALTAGEMRRLDARCRDLGIDLVPNQNSFGHLRQWLEYPPLRRLAEVPAPYETEGGGFLRFPSTLAPNHPGTMRFLRQLYDELLPNFSSRYFNAGCDETWDLGLGQSRRECQRRGQGRVYLEFLKRIHREVTRRRRQMMFWGDIILRYPDLIGELPRDVIALNWGYEADHPFEREAALFSQSGVQFYVCPGTSTWMTLVGRHDNALANLRAAAEAGRRHAARGYLITDWGDGGHPQPLAVSYLPYLAGAALSWCAESFDDKLLSPVLSRDVFCDPSRRLSEAAWALGLAHRKFKYTEANSTPFGTTIAAPAPGSSEQSCWNGLKNYTRIQAGNVRAALAAVHHELTKIDRSRPLSAAGRMLRRELKLAARMAAQSCTFMLWQQAVAGGSPVSARRLARGGIRELRALDKDLNACWALRNKGTTEKCAAFLRWRIRDYESGSAGTQASNLISQISGEKAKV